MRYPDYLVHYNKNHDKKTGRFTFGDGNGDGVSPDDYRTPELDKKYSELEKTGVLTRESKKWLTPSDDPEKEWGKDWAKAARIGLEAQKRWFDPGDIEETDSLSWFMFEDQTIGMPEVAYLVNAGWSKDKIIDIFKTANTFRDYNSKYEDAYVADKNVKIGDKKWHSVFNDAFNSSPYKGTYAMTEGYWQMDGGRSPDHGELGEFIDACIKVSKDMKHSDIDYSEYLMHFNKNHDKKSGRFSFGDGDGDGVRDDHSNQTKKQSESDGSKKTVVVSSLKNEHNPFSGHKKTKIEVSDDVYKEIMKSDTKHDIIRGSSSLVSGGLYLAAGILTENPVALGVGVAFLLSSAANYVDSGTHFVNNIIDKKYKDKPVEEFDKLIKLDPTIFGKKYYDPTTKEIVNLNLKQVRERNKSTGIAT